jgi:predicted nucleic acid-binding protein
MARRSKIVVLDSSVAVKWFSNEAKSDETINVMDSHVEGSIEFSVSEPLFYEVANAVNCPLLKDVGLRSAIICHQSSEFS